MGLLSLLETAALNGAVQLAVYGQRGAFDEIATNLYSALRPDQAPVDIIYAEGLGEEGLGLAIMNRLRQAASYHILEA